MKQSSQAQVLDKWEVQDIIHSLKNPTEGTEQIMQ